MNKLLCAALFAAMAAGTARAADNALAGLKAAASPAALENAVPLVPAPATAPVAGVTVTPLDEATIQGEYLVKTAAMPLLRITLAGGEVTLVKPDPAGDLVCKGTYKLDLEKLDLINDFVDCGGSILTHTMYLKGQTVESLAAGAKVLSTILMDGDITPGVPVKIQKTK